MTSVALETSARPPSVAARNEQRSLSAALAADRQHASDLLPTLDRLLSALGSRPADLRAVIVGTGPGSYTGLRVGIATALGLARGTGAQLMGVASGETLAYAELAPGEEGVQLIDARQGELYFAHYRRLADEVEIVRAPCVLKASEVEAALPAGVPIFADSAAIQSAGLAGWQQAEIVVDRIPRAEFLLELGLTRLARRGAMSASAIEPLYLRPFAATRRRR